MWFFHKYIEIWSHIRAQMRVRCCKTVLFPIWCGAPVNFEGIPGPLEASAFHLSTGSLGLSHLRLPHWPLWSVSQLCFSPMGLPRQVHRWLLSWPECRSVVPWPQLLPLRGWAMVSTYDHGNTVSFLEASVSGVYLDPSYFFYLFLWAPADGTSHSCPSGGKEGGLLNKEAECLGFWLCFFYFSGSPTSLASASGSFPNSGLYGSYPQGQAPPLGQGHPGAQPPQRSVPPQASSFTPPASGGPRMPSMTGPLLPGQSFGGPPVSQPNHVSSPPPQALPPGAQMTGPPGPPPPMHSPQQPGYQLQQNGEFFPRTT